MTLIRYIHRNPVRAKLVKRPNQYRWNSQKDYFIGIKGLIDIDRALRIFLGQVYKPEEIITILLGDAIDLKYLRRLETKRGARHTRYQIKNLT